VIALIVSRIEDEKQTARIVQALPENLQADVMYRMSTLEVISEEVLRQIEEALKEDMAASYENAQIGGIKQCARILNELNKATEYRILPTIEEVNPNLAVEVRKLMFIFEDLVLIDRIGMQQILKETDQQDLLLSLKTASEAVKELIFSSMTERAGEMVRDDLKILGPVKLVDVEMAQKKIVQIALQLEEEGKIIIGGSEQPEANENDGSLDQEEEAKEEINSEDEILDSFFEDLSSIEDIEETVPGGNQDSKPNEDGDREKAPESVLAGKSPGLLESPATFVRKRLPAWKWIATIRSFWILIAIPSPNSSSQRKTLACLMNKR